MARGAGGIATCIYSINSTDLVMASLNFLILLLLLPSADPVSLFALFFPGVERSFEVAIMAFSSAVSYSALFW